MGKTFSKFPWAICDWKKYKLKSQFSGGICDWAQNKNTAKNDVINNDYNEFVEKGKRLKEIKHKCKFCNNKFEIKMEQCNNVTSKLYINQFMCQQCFDIKKKQQIDGEERMKKPSYDEISTTFLYLSIHKRIVINLIINEVE